jgi:hypothetical protein
MRRGTVLIVTMLAMLVVAVPAAGDTGNAPPETGNVVRFSDPGFGIAAAPDDGVWILANIDSVADFCNDPEPIPATPDAVQLVLLPNGAVVVLVQPGVVPVTVVPFVTGDPFFDTCSGPATAVASGSVRVTVNDNDAPVTLTRTNVFGEQGNGTATAPDGTQYQVHFHIKLQIQKQTGEFRVLSEGASFRALPG